MTKVTFVAIKIDLKLKADVFIESKVIEMMSVNNLRGKLKPFNQVASDLFMFVVQNFLGYQNRNSSRFEYRDGWFCFPAYQPLLVIIQCLILLMYIC